MAVPVLARHRGGLLVAVVALVTAVAIALAVTAFTADRTKSSLLGSAKPAGTQPATVAPASTTPPIPKVTIGVSSAVKGVQSWSKPVRVKVAHGTLLSLTATDDRGVVLGGTLAASSWVSTGVVIPSRTYQLQAYVRGLDGSAKYHTLKVTTTAPARTVAVRVNLQVGPAVGVGWPITVHFTEPVTNRAAVQNALQVQTSVPVTGAWHWFSDTEVHYRPQAYWPAHTQITLHRNLDGIEVAPGVWGLTEKDLNFNIGDKHVTTVDAATPGQHMTVTVNDKPIGDYPVSTGRPALPTLGGVHIVLEKFAVKEMKSWTLIPPIPKLLPNGKKNPAAYDEKELWSTRISNAGAFVHYQPGTLKQQGHAAASHGCVNTNLAAAEKFYNLSLPGDIVNVINSPAPPNRADPGMQDWNYTWAQWLAGSATGA
jgi:lipoprotein-anchoring transpeptidase ErfK/SrfK